MAGNTSLQRAKAAKYNEFYTRLTDIEKELKHYRKHFKNKVVFCNCDDPFESQFFKFFVLNFNRLQLKKLICTCYAGSPVMGKQMTFADLIGKTDAPSDKPYKAVVNELYDITGDGYIDHEDIFALFKSGENTLEELQGDGDFRSEECIQSLIESDIVCTNPPFSLFTEYITQLMEYKKKFLIICDQDKLHYKEVFPYIRDNEIWIGYNHVPEFMTPNGPQKFGKTLWITNLDIRKRHEDLILIKRYKEDAYDHYDNFDGIDVKKIADIPRDYDGYIGIPDNFLEIHNPDQFEIVGLGTGNLAKEIGVGRNYRGRTDISYTKDGKHVCPYSRIIIRNKNPEK